MGFAVTFSSSSSSTAISGSSFPPSITKIGSVRHATVDLNRRRRAVLKPLITEPRLNASTTRAAPLAEQESAIVSDSLEENVLEVFFKDREVNGDFISKVSDELWKREVLKVVDTTNASKPDESTQQSEQVIKSDGDSGFLKLSSTQEWLLGDNSAPNNKKAMAKVMRDDSERRKKLNILQYEAIKRELTLLSVGIGTLCTGYCLIVLSFQAAVSYAVGVLFSCLYLQLLCQHVDNLSQEMVPQIFKQKKSKKIGIRSEDLQDSFEKTIKGSGIALSSPRLVIPAAVYGLWILSHKIFPNDIFDFQLVPAMVGIFVYKAAALVQVYRDNEDLRLIFPDNE